MILIKNDVKNVCGRKKIYKNEKFINNYLQRK